METVERELKAIVDESGPGVLTRSPYQVFERLRGAGGDLGLSAALLHVFVMGVSDHAQEGLTQAELEDELMVTCHFDEEMTAAVARVLRGLFSKENTDAWKERDRAGFDAFCAHQHTFAWEGYYTWDGVGDTVECTFNLTAVVEVASKELVEEYLGEDLTKDPFMDEEKIERYFDSSMDVMMDGELVYYCDVDYYRPPAMDRFPYLRSLREWCEEVGFRLVSAEGKGETGDYEPEDDWF